MISKGHGVPGRVRGAGARRLHSRVDELEDAAQASTAAYRAIPTTCGLPYIEAATGSLGQGLSVAVGMALAERLDRQNDYRVYCLLGDGELQAGQIWEAAMSAGKFGLAKLTAIVDYNKVQLDGHVRTIMDLEPLAAKFERFGGTSCEVDGHDHESRCSMRSPRREAETDRPNVIIAHTVKGKGVSFMEDTHAWHGKAPNREELERAPRRAGGGS